MIPLFALGIPASGTTAVLLGGLLMVGLQPGPLLFTTNPDFVWTVFGSFWIGNMMLVVLTTLLIPVLASIVYISTAVLYPVVIGIVIFGVYSIHYSMSDVTIALLAGAVGFVMLKLDYSPVPLVLGLVLGPLLERGVHSNTDCVRRQSGDLRSAPDRAGVVHPDDWCARAPGHHTPALCQGRAGAVDDGVKRVEVGRLGRLLGFWESISHTPARSSRRSRFVAALRHHQVKCRRLPNSAIWNRSM